MHSPETISASDSDSNAVNIGRRSWTAEYVQVSKDSNWLLCNLCKSSKQIKASKWKNVKSGVTGNIKKHLASVHKIFNNRADTPKGPIEAYMHPKVSQEEFNKVAAQWIIKDGRPFVVGESPSFQEMLKLWRLLPKSARFPSPSTVKRNLDDLHSAGIEKMKERLEVVDSRIHLTMDCWTSTNLMDFCAFGAHFIDSEWKLQAVLLDFVPMPDRHTADELLALVKDVVNDFSLIDRVGCITADSASNNIALCRKLKEDVSTFQDFTHIPCLAHVLNLAAQAAIAEFKPIIETMRSYVLHIQSSATRWKRYLYCREREGFHGPRVELDTPTRWNSCYSMLQRCIDQFEVLQRYESQSRLEENKLNLLNEDDRRSVKQLCQFLEQFKMATDIFSTQNELLSAAVLRYSILVDNTWMASEDETLPPILRQGAVAAYSKLCKYFAEHDLRLYYLATILDPRYKMKAYKRLNWAQEYMDIAKEFITDAVKETSVSNAKELRNRTESVPSDDRPSSRMSMILAELDEDCTEEPTDELSLYLSEPVLKKASTDDVLNYWKSSSSRFPRLAKLASDYLSIPCTSVDIERQFSSARHMLPPNRQSMEAKTLQKLMCVKDWY